jgi:hypothetical protein
VVSDAPAAAAPAPPEVAKGPAKVAMAEPAEAGKTAAAGEQAKPAVATASDQLRGTVAATAASVTPAPSPAKPTVSTPPAAPAAAANRAPIAIFISRKEKKIYVRQNFNPLFDAPVTIADPAQPIGTLVFTAMDLMDDGSTFHWNVFAFPGDPPRVKRTIEYQTRSGRWVKRTVEDVVKTAGPVPPPQTPAEALARIEISQDVIDRISALMVPGSSLVVSDQGLGDETGEGTDFIVVTRE